jgi:hypothetical protein
MPVHSEKASPITDRDAAQRFDLSSRILRVTLLLGGTQWLFVAALLKVTAHLPLTVAVLIALVGSLYNLGLIGYFARLHRARLSQFTDPMTGEIGVPGGRLPLPRGLRHAPWAFLAEIAVLLVLHGGTGPSIPVAHGFPGDNTQAPAVGTWQASGVVISTAGYSGSTPGLREERLWQIDESCVRPGSCSYSISREILGERNPEPPLTAALIPERDGWHATFPTREYVCHETPSETIDWPEHLSLVLRFTDGGDVAEANGRDYSYTARCGYGTSLVRWRARRLAEHSSSLVEHNLPPSSPGQK